MQRLTLGHTERLKSRKQIDLLFSEGKRFALSPFRVYHLRDKNMSGLQAGFGVSTRNFKNAVDRNRIKRLLREAYRLQKTRLKQLTIVQAKGAKLFFLYSAKELPGFKEIKQKMGMILEKLEKEFA